MSDYRLYSCRPDGHFSQRLDFDAADDDAAMAKANDLLTTVRGELWAGPRKIAELDTRKLDGAEPPPQPQRRPEDSELR